MIDMFRTYLRAYIGKFVKSERGATAVEYGVMVALIAVAIIAAVTLLGTTLSDKFESVKDSVAGAGAGS